MEVLFRILFQMQIKMFCCTIQLLGLHKNFRLLAAPSPINYMNNTLSHIHRQKCQQRKRLTTGLSNVLQQQTQQILYQRIVIAKNCLSAVCVETLIGSFIHNQIQYNAALQATVGLFFMRTLPTLGPGLSFCLLHGSHGKWRRLLHIYTCMYMHTCTSVCTFNNIH